MYMCRVHSRTSLFRADAARSMLGGFLFGFFFLGFWALGNETLFWMRFGEVSGRVLEAFWMFWVGFGKFERTFECPNTFLRRHHQNIGKPKNALNTDKSSFHETSVKHSKTVHMLHTVRITDVSQSKNCHGHAKKKW